jgi:hypothetical protein
MNKPVHTIKDKGLSVAIWESRGGGYTYSVQKRYKDKQTGEWKDSRYLYKEDVVSLVNMLQSAIDYASDRAEHSHEGIPSGQGKAGPSATYEIDDDIPW